MIKKIILLALLATTIFATPVVVSFDNPIPECFPCPKGMPGW